MRTSHVRPRQRPAGAQRQPAGEQRRLRRCAPTHRAPLPLGATGANGGSGASSGGSSSGGTGTQLLEWHTVDAPTLWQVRAPRPNALATGAAPLVAASGCETATCSAAGQLLIAHTCQFTPRLPGPPRHRAGARIAGSKADAAVAGAFLCTHC